MNHKDSILGRLYSYAKSPYNSFLSVKSVGFYEIRSICKEKSIECLAVSELIF
jgi:hypothetical protein